MLDTKMEGFAQSHEVKKKFDEVDQELSKWLYESVFVKYKKTIGEDLDFCKKTVEKFTNDNIHIKSIVSRFDEVLWGKSLLRTPL